MAPRLSTSLRIGLFAALVASHLPAARAAQLEIITTTLPLYSFAASIAGQTAHVENLLPQGVGPHDYQPSVREARKLHSAGLVVVSGLGLDDWLNRFIQAEGGSAKICVASAGFGPRVVHGATPLLGRSDRGDLDVPNPHFWLDPTLAAAAVTNILDAVIKADSPHAEAYRANAARLLSDLTSLDAGYARELVPCRGTAFITFHDAFPYLSQRYQLKLAGVVEVVPDVEPSPKYLIELSGVVRREKVAVLFVEPQFSTKLADQLCSDLGMARAELDPLETGNLTASAYLDGMRRNLKTLKEVLRGK
jgi:zinc transport system substrate-binding protein